MTTTDLNTLSAKELVRHHNNIPGVAPITILWKASKASLLEKIRIAQAAADVAKAEVNKKVDTAKKSSNGAGRSSDLVKFANAHSMNAKVLRARLRKAGMSAPYDMAKVEAFLTSKA